MNLKFFDVEHGACALLTADDNTRLMIDCGHNDTRGWMPGTYLKQQGITALDMLSISNYDEDHVSGLINLDASVNIGWLARNPMSTNVIRGLKSEGTGKGIAHLLTMIDQRYNGTVGSAPPPFADVTQRFYNVPPAFDDENNLSLAQFVRYHGIGFLFPGDLERAGWLELLKNQSFRSVLSQTNVLLASHHGRESGCCEEAMALCTNLYYVVISDMNHQYETQKTLGFYAKYAKGGPFRGTNRSVLTTRNDGMIQFDVTAGRWTPR